MASHRTFARRPQAESAHVLGARVLDQFICRSGRSSRTQQAYMRDLDLLSEHLGTADACAAVASVIRLGPDGTTRMLQAWNVAMLADDWAESTRARRMNTVRSLVKTAYRMGVIRWLLDVQIAAPAVQHRAAEPEHVAEVSRHLEDLDDVTLGDELEIST